MAISEATDTKITIAVDLEPALGATIDYLADRWETKNPAPRDVLLAPIKDTLEHLIEDMLIDDWSWYLENDRTQYADGIPRQQLTRLLADRTRLEEQITSLIAVKTLYEPLVYDDKLEALLVEFALVHRALRPTGTLQ